MQIFCDESGGVGRGVMTLAAVAISADVADGLVAQFRAQTGLTSELKGSRIDLVERALFFDLFEASNAKAVVGFSTIALRPLPGEDRGDLDRSIYVRLLDEVVSVLLLESGGCASITIDDGRYAPATLSLIRDDMAAMIGPCGNAALELSHRSAGLQIADVIANTMFNRALPSERQGRFLAMTQPLLASRRIRIELLDTLAI
jgi:Protein of unknown function (DUF3800)